MRIWLIILIVWLSRRPLKYLSRTRAKISLGDTASKRVIEEQSLQLSTSTKTSIALFVERSSIIFKPLLFVDWVFYPVSILSLPPSRIFHRTLNYENTRVVFSWGNIYHIQWERFFPSCNSFITIWYIKSCASMKRWSLYLSCTLQRMP